jgi:hypothetical protein
VPLHDGLLDTHSRGQLPSVHSRSHLLPAPQTHLLFWQVPAHDGLFCSHTAAQLDLGLHVIAHEAPVMQMHSLLAHCAVHVVFGLQMALQLPEVQLRLQLEQPSAQMHSPSAQESSQQVPGEHESQPGRHAPPVDEELGAPVDELVTVDATDDPTADDIAAVPLPEPPLPPLPPLLLDPRPPAPPAPLLVASLPPVPLARPGPKVKVSPHATSARTSATIERSRGGMTSERTTHRRRRFKSRIRAWCTSHGHATVHAFLRGARVVGKLMK